MTIAAGTTLSHYEVLGPLGAGAMGEVYRARDTRLGREVAIKVLPSHFAEEPERMARFEREARSLASLNHPNIAQIHGVDQDQGLYFLTLELVPGETLEDRLKRGALPVDEAIDVCRQIAEGLEAAHEAGVIHRDLKPANVRITPDGRVKLLDFGLAKASGKADGSHSSTDSVLTTEAGRLLERSGLRSKPRLAMMRCSQVLLAGGPHQPCTLQTRGSERYLYVQPHGDHTLIGSTERLQGLDDPVTTAPEDIDYLLKCYNRCFTRQKSTADVVGTTSGIRPMLRLAGSRNRLNYNYLIERQQGLLTVYGGQWTTARALGAKVADNILP